MRRANAWTLAVALALPAFAAAQSLPARVQRSPVPPLVRFAVIGDYGLAGPGEQAVASLVRSWSPSFVLTVGDNNYTAGAQATIDANIGQYWADWIFPYSGAHPSSAVENRFFPALGNHDWATPSLAPYLAYFTLPGNERYYDFRRGPVHVFVVDSDPHEPDGIDASSTQAQWLQSALAASSAPFKIVAFHHAPYSSALHGNAYALQWPFRAWGADLVLSGHDHSYERVLVDGFPYVVDGLGGHSTLYAFGDLAVAGSETRFDLAHGALRVEADDELCTLRFVDVAGTVVDQLAIGTQPFDELDVPLVAAGSSWKYKADGSNQGSAWTAPAFDDSSWPQGNAQLGYGEGDEATVIPGGPSSSHFVTSYMRRTFQVSSPASLRILRLELVRDDGAAVYVNGQEVLRDNLPPSAAWNTFAVARVDVDENAWRPYDVPASVLVAGTNTIAVEVHQFEATSSDVSFDLRLTGYADGTRLLARGSTWKYRDAGVDPGPDWMLPTYSDAGWPSGPAELGYGEGDEATTTSFGPDPQNRPIASWYRTSFACASPAAFQALVLATKSDDAVRVWLNGREVWRRNLTIGAVTPATRAARDLVAPDENAFVRATIDARPLVAGQNVIAVEVHQFDAQSDDLSFDLELTGY